MLDINGGEVRVQFCAGVRVCLSERVCVCMFCVGKFVRVRACTAVCGREYRQKMVEVQLIIAGAAGSLYREHAGTQPGHSRATAALVQQLLRLSVFVSGAK